MTLLKNVLYYCHVSDFKVFLKKIRETALFSKKLVKPMYYFLGLEIALIQPFFKDIELI